MNMKLVNPPSIVKRICERYRAGYSPVILFCGKMRSGKTTKAYLLLHWISWILFGHAWNWKDGTMISFDQIIEKIDDPDTPIKLADEIQRMFSKRDVQKQESVLGNKLLTSQAYMHYLFAMIMPRASGLGGDHIANVDYVIYVRDRKCIMPYKIDNNLWDIDIKKRGVKKTFMSHFNLDIEDPVIQEAFKDELKDLDEFKKYIETHLKAPIMDQIKEKRGLNPIISPKPIKIKDN